MLQKNRELRKSFEYENCISLFGRFFRFIRETGYDGDLTFEGTGFDQNGKVDIRSLNAQFDLARDYLSRKG